jgi:HEAT repeat protein
MYKYLAAFMLCLITVIWALPQSTLAQTADLPTTPSAKKARQIEAILSENDTNASEKLKAFLTDGDWYVRGTASRALGKTGDKSAAKLLLPLLEDTNWYVKTAALESLSVLEDRSTAPEIEKLLRSEDPFIKAKAADTLGRLRDESATEALIGTLQDGEANVRRAGASALGQIKATKAAEGLQNLLNDEDASVRKAAAIALGKLGSAGAEPLVNKAARQADEGDWEYAASLYRLGNRNELDRVVAALKSPYSDTRQQAFLTLIDFADSRALPPLVEYLKTGPTSQDGDSPFVLKVTLVKALEKFKGDGTQEFLIGFINEDAPGIRRSAIDSLIKWTAANPNEDRKFDTLKALVNRLKKEKSPEILSAIDQALLTFDRNKTEDLLLSATEENGKLSENIVNALAGVGVTPETVAGRLASGDVNAKIQAAEQLIKFTDPKALEPLIVTIGSTQEVSLRIKAAEILGRARDRRAVDKLMLSSSAREPELRIASIKALGLIGDPQATDALFAAANDSNEKVHQASVEALEKLGISVERLSGDLANPNWQTRVAGLSTMAKIGDRKAVPLAINSLKDGDARVRAEAAQVLGILRDNRAVDPLMNSLGDQSVEVRIQATTALGYLRDNRALPLLTTLLNDKDSRVSLAAAESLARMQDPKATQVLLNSLTSQDWRTRSRAAQVLARVAIEGGGSTAFVEPLTEALRDKDPLVRYHAAEGLTAMGAKAVPSLINLLWSAKDNERVRAARLLTRIGKPAVEPLIGMLLDRETSLESKIAAINSLGIIADERAIKPLAVLLRDQNSTIRQHAAFALGLLGKPAADQLLEMANSSTAATREGAIEALGGMRTPAAIDKLIASLNDSSPQVRLAAVRALGDTGSERAVRPLIDLIKGENSPLKTQAAASLGRLGEVALPGLIGLLRDPQPATRSLAATALGEIGSKGSVAALIELVKADTSPARGDAIEALGKIGSPLALDTLLPLAHSGSVSLRRKTITALSQIDDNRVVETLVAALTDQYEEIRQIAAVGLGNVGNRAVIPALERVAQNDTNSDVRDAAINSIEQIKSQERLKQSDIRRNK